MSNGIRLLISGIAGLVTTFLTVMVFEMAGSLNWTPSTRGIPGLVGIAAGVIVFQRCRKALMRRYTPDDMVREIRRLK